MDIKVACGTSAEADGRLQEQQQPLLENQPNPGKRPKTPAQKAIRKTFKGTAHLANLLPTGSVLVFQFLSPVLTNEGKCPFPINKFMTTGLLGFCGASCFLLSFTDSFRDERGKVRYGFATFRGVLVLDGSVTISPEEAAKYKVRFIDFLHAFMSILVFAAVALLDQNVINCFLPNPSKSTKELIGRLPVGIGIICTLFFIAFPSKRHGIGFPLSKK